MRCRIRTLALRYPAFASASLINVSLPRHGARMVRASSASAGHKGRPTAAVLGPCPRTRAAASRWMPRGSCTDQARVCEWRAPAAPVPGDAARGLAHERSGPVRRVRAGLRCGPAAVSGYLDSRDRGLCVPHRACGKTDGHGLAPEHRTRLGLMTRSMAGDVAVSRTRSHASSVCGWTRPLPDAPRAAFMRRTGERQEGALVCADGRERLALGMNGQ